MATVRVSNAGKPLKPKQALPVKTIKTATASDQATAYAKEIRKAVNPSGRPVDINSDGTKEMAIQNIGSRMRKQTPLMHRLQVRIRDFTTSF